MLELAVAAFVTLFVVVDPVGVAPLFVSITPRETPAARRQAAIKGVVVAGVLMIGFAFIGQPLLDTLGIGLPAFRIAGGLLLLLLAIDMVMVRDSGLRATAPKETEEGRQREDVSVFPLAIPLIAGPGALTSVVLLMGRAQGQLLHMGAIVGVILAVLALTLGSLLLTGRIIRLLGVTGVNVITRVFGIITAALALQYIVDGVLAVWPS